MTTQPDRLREAQRRDADWAKAEFDGVREHPDTQCSADFDRHFLLAALAEAAPAPDLLAAVETVREWRFAMWGGDTLVVYTTDEDPGDMGEPRSVEEDDRHYVAVRAVLAAPASREAGLDADGLAALANATIVDESVYFNDDLVAHGRIIEQQMHAAGFSIARLATSPAPAEKTEPK